MIENKPKLIHGKYLIIWLVVALGLTTTISYLKIINEVKIPALDVLLKAIWLLGFPLSAYVSKKITANKEKGTWLAVIVIILTAWELIVFINKMFMKLL